MLSAATIARQVVKYLQAFLLQNKPLLALCVWCSEQFFKKYKKRSLRLHLLGHEFLYFRHPDDCTAILDSQGACFNKVPGVLRLSRIVGSGLVSQVCPAHSLSGLNCGCHTADKQSVAHSCRSQTRSSIKG